MGLLSRTGLLLICMAVLVGSLAWPSVARSDTPPNTEKEDKEWDGTLASPGAATSTEQETVWRINLERAAVGVPPLKLTGALTTAAQGHSQDMALNDFLSHTGSNGSSFVDRMEAAGYTQWSHVAENVAAGQDTPAAVVAAWMGSAGHRDNILNPQLRETGVGHTYLANDSGSVNYNHYWTQNFGARFDVYPIVIENEQPTVTKREVALYSYGAGWAQEMRLSSDGASWTAWQPFQAQQTWMLSGENGVKTVYIELRRDAQLLRAQDEVVLELACVLEGDLDGSGVVDVQDIQMVVEVWRQPLASGDARDLNSDGVINLLDVAIIARAWNTRC